MKVVVCHNFYQQPGGEDGVFADETALLESHGHRVVRFTVHNDSIGTGIAGRLALFGQTTWNESTAREIGRVAKRERADVVHFHNTFPLISPAAYYSARRAGAAVVQTLHNYRLLCPGSMFLRDGAVCEKCLGKAPLAAVIHKCYRGSAAASAATAAMIVSHRAMATYRQQVDAYVALTQFGREKFIAGGLPARKIAVKPNFVSPDPGPGPGGKYAVFVGRLAPGKGLETLLEAWARHGTGMPLKVLGDGPLAPAVREAAGSGAANVEWLGRRPTAEVYDTIGAAAALVMPSVWYEGLPKTLIESFAKGTPVVASRLGALKESVTHGRTGLHFQPGDAADLARQVRRLSDNPDAAAAMRAECRREFERYYTADQNYDLLMRIYKDAIDVRNGKPKPSPLRKRP